MKIIGLMSGTSADGVDTALVEINQRRQKLNAKLLEFNVYKFPLRLKQLIFQLFLDQAGSLSLTCQLNFALGKIFAEAVLELLRKSRVSPQEVQAIGSHGQTVYHLPPSLAKQKSAIPSTLQIGDASVIALHTGITTVADFRTADVAVGGEGAPLIPFADFHLLAHPRRTRIVQNIGGIANCTVLPAGCKLADVTAFDTGPGNMVIDALVRIVTAGKKQFDKNGSLARRGQINKEILRHYLAHPYFKIIPPKTTGRELFGEQFAQKFWYHCQQKQLSPLDAIATATALTAESIIQAYEQFIFPRYKVSEVILGGGGAENKSIVGMLRDRLPPDIKLLKHEDLGINSKAKEAIGFALLAYACIKRIPANVPAVTGASRPVILGKIYQP